MTCSILNLSGISSDQLRHKGKEDTWNSYGAEACCRLEEGMSRLEELVSCWTKRWKTECSYMKEPAIEWPQSCWELKANKICKWFKCMQQHLTMKMKKSRNYIKKQQRSWKRRRVTSKSNRQFQCESWGNITRRWSSTWAFLVQRS